MWTGRVGAHLWSAVCAPWTRGTETATDTYFLVGCLPTSSAGGILCTSSPTSSSTPTSSCPSFWLSSTTTTGSTWRWRRTWGPAGVSRLAGVGAARPACALAKCLSVLVVLPPDESGHSFARLNSAGPGGSLSVWHGSDAVSQLQGGSWICSSLFFFPSFWPGHLACVILVPPPGIEPCSGRAES